MLCCIFSFGNIWFIGTIGFLKIILCLYLMTYVSYFVPKENPSRLFEIRLSSEQGKPEILCSDGL